MKERLASLIRHAITALPALGGYLASKGWLTGAEGSQLDAALTDALAVIGAILAAVVTRLVMQLVGKHAPALKDFLKDDDDSSKGGPSSGVGGGLAMALFFVGIGMHVTVLPSCSAVSGALGGTIPATAVQRAGNEHAQPVLIASADLAQAEEATAQALERGESPPIYGTYDAGRAAERLREVFTERSVSPSSK